MLSFNRKCFTTVLFSLDSSLLYSISLPIQSPSNDFIALLRNKNVPFENSKGTPDTTNTRPDGVKQIYFQDPDGYWIEVNNSKLEDF